MSLPSDCSAPRRWARDRDTESHALCIPTGSCPMEGVLPYGEVLQHPHPTPAGFQLCSPSLPAGCWPQGSRPEPGGSCGTLPKPAVWTPRTAGRRKAPWLWVIDQLGRRETWVLEEGGETSSPYRCPTLFPGPQSWTCCARDAPSPGTTQSWNSGTHTSPGRMHSSWASVREEGGCGQAKGGRGIHLPPG